MREVVRLQSAAGGGGNVEREIARVVERVEPSVEDARGSRSEAARVRVQGRAAAVRMGAAGARRMASPLRACDGNGRRTGLGVRIREGDARARTGHRVWLRRRE